jgi:hypothetical protein
VATGRLNYEQPLEVGDRIEIGGQHGSRARSSWSSENAIYGLSCSCCAIAADDHGDVSSSGPVGARATSVRPCSRQRHEIAEVQSVKALQTGPYASHTDPLLTRDSTQTTRNRDLQVF